MKLSKHLLAAITITLTIGCGQNSQTSGSFDLTSNLTNGTTLPVITGNNVLTLTVNGSTCNNSTAYTNEPCVSVTICSTTNANCQTINDILVDTGSYGLRVFKSVISSNISLSPVMSGGENVTQCVQFGDGSADWGKVELAKVTLGGESAVQVPIQVIDSTYSNSSTYCSGADTSPSEAGFNGILGVGLFAEDCGVDCTSDSNNGVYYACNGTSCSGVAVSIADQVTNPVALLPVDNNGVIVELPSVALGGITSANGYLILGIGTQSNNIPSHVVAYSADSSTGEFTTSFSGTNYPSFLDSGSNGLFFPSTLPDCGSTDQSFSGFFCPSSTTSLNAIDTASSGSLGIIVPFEIGNAINLLNSTNSVFVELGGNGGQMFDWGLPFYMGRNVFVGIENRSSALGVGPYWAF